MSYTKTTWVSGQAPAITAVNLNHIEEGVQNAHEAVGAEGTLYKKVELSGFLLYPPTIQFNPNPATLYEANVLGWKLPPNADSEVKAQFAIPFDFKEGSDLSFFVKMYTMTDVSSTELAKDVSVRFSAYAINNNISDSGTMNVTGIVPNIVTDSLLSFGFANTSDYYTEYIHTLPDAYYTSRIIAGKTVLNLNFQRLAAGNVSSNDLVVYSLGIIYEVDGNGSASKTSKVKTW